MIRTLLFTSQISTNHEGHRTDLINEIVSSSKTHNAKHQITGVLAYDHDHFFHVLEGENEQISHLVEKIKQDSRHSNFNVMFDLHWPERIFAEWNVAGEHSEDIKTKFNEYLKVNIEALPLLNDSQFNILSKFVETVFH